jgi:putative membrane protein
MRKLLLRLIINAVALYVAVALMSNSGISPTSQHWYDYLWLALIFGVINAVIKPILVVASCPLLVLTLGLGTLLINTLLFFLAGWIGTQFGVGFTVSGFVPAFVGALIVSVVSFILSQIFRDDLR